MERKKKLFLETWIGFILLIFVFLFGFFLDKKALYRISIIKKNMLNLIENTTGYDVSIANIRPTLLGDIRLINTIIVDKAGNKLFRAGKITIGFSFLSLLRGFDTIIDKTDIEDAFLDIKGIRNLLDKFTSRDTDIENIKLKIILRNINFEYEEKNLNLNLNEGTINIQNSFAGIFLTTSLNSKNIFGNKHLFSSSFSINLSTIINYNIKTHEIIKSSILLRDAFIFQHRISPKNFVYSYINGKFYLSLKNNPEIFSFTYDTSEKQGKIKTNITVKDTKTLELSGFNTSISEFSLKMNSVIKKELLKTNNNINLYFAGLFGGKAYNTILKISGSFYKSNIDLKTFIDGKEIFLKGYAGKKNRLFLSSNGVKIFGKYIKGKISLIGTRDFFEISLNKIRYNRAYMNNMLLRFYLKNGIYSFKTPLSDTGLYASGIISSLSKENELYLVMKNFPISSIPFLADKYRSNGYFSGRVNIKYKSGLYQVVSDKLSFFSYSGFVRNVKTSFSFNNNLLKIKFLNLFDGEDRYKAHGEIRRSDNKYQINLFLNYDEVDYNISALLLKDPDIMQGDIIINKDVVINFTKKGKDLKAGIKLNSIPGLKFMNLPIFEKKSKIKGEINIAYINGKLSYKGKLDFIKPYLIGYYIDNSEMVFKGNSKSMIVNSWDFRVKDIRRVCSGIVSFRKKFALINFHIDNRYSVIGKVNGDEVDIRGYLDNDDISILKRVVPLFEFLNYERGLVSAKLHVFGNASDPDLDLIVNIRKNIIAGKNFTKTEADIAKRGENLLLHKINIYDNYKKVFSINGLINFYADHYTYNLRLIANNADIYVPLKGRLSIKGRHEDKNNNNHILLKSPTLTIANIKMGKIEYQVNYSSKVLLLKRIIGSGLEAKINFVGKKFFLKRCVFLLKNKEIVRLLGYGDFGKGKSDLKLFINSLNIDFFNPISRYIRRSKGYINGYIHLIGSLKEPIFSGMLNISNALLKTDVFIGDIRNLQSQISIKNNRINIDYCTASSGNGGFTISGSMRISGYSFKDFDLHMVMDRNKGIRINYPLIKISGLARGDIEFSGTIMNPLFKANITLDDTSFTWPPSQWPETDDDSFINSISWFVNITAQRNVQFFNDLFGANITLSSGSYINIKGKNSTGLIISGDLSVKDGTIDYLGTPFNIEQCRLWFDEKDETHYPYIKGEAETIVFDKANNREVDIKMILDDRFDRLEPNLISSPPLGKMDIVYLLDRGHEFKEASEEEAVKMLGFAAALVLHESVGSTLLKPVQRKIKRIFRLDVLNFRANFFNNLLVPGEYSELLTDPTSMVDNTSFMVGKYITKNFFIKYEGILRNRNREMSYDHAFSLEWRIRPLNFEISYSPVENSAGVQAGFIKDHQANFRFNWRESF